MDIWKSLGGMVAVEVTSADLAAAFESMNRAEIPLYSVTRQDGYQIRFYFLDMLGKIENFFFGD